VPVIGRRSEVPVGQEDAGASLFACRPDCVPML
jgi:hypothetical protein